MQYKYVFAYLRLSNDDMDKDDVSNSIKNQKLLIEYFVRNHDELKDAEIVFFVDDGYSGTNFNRPDFQRMIEQVRHSPKSICIVVKDLSRFGRDTITTQNYIEKVFPFLQVRFIAVNDYYDSNTTLINSRDTEIKFKNLINGIYPEICSKNIKQVIRKLGEKGRYLGAMPPYGYLISDDGNRTLVLDKETAPVVRYIFGRRLAGDKYSEIARKLERKGIPCPYNYLRSKGFSCTGIQDIKKQWSRESVCSILTNPIYLGIMENHKTETITPRGKCRHIPRSERIYVEGTHEAIVTKEEFEQVASMIKHITTTLQRNNREKYLFTGKVRCGHCHRMMRIRLDRKNIKMNCNSIKIEDSKCFKGTYPMDQLEVLILKMIRQEAAKASNALKQIKEMNKIVDLSKLRRKKGAYEGRLKTCRRQKMELYEKFALETLSKESYLSRKQEIKQKEAGFKEQAAEIGKKIAKAEAEKARENSPGLKRFAKYTELEALSYEIIQELVDTIYFYDPEHIEIIWNYQDDYLETADESAG